MLLFIGGAARAGKGILSRRLLKERQLPYLSLDVLKMGIARGMPDRGFDPDAGAPQVAEELWPIVREMSASLLHERESYVFEGEVLPKHIDALRQSFQDQVQSCFLGYPEMTPAQKLQQIRAHAGHPNDWSQAYADEALLVILRREIAFSEHLRKECTNLNLPFFDMSAYFEESMERVVAHINSIIQPDQPDSNG